MIEYDEALKIARGKKKGINHCVEYTNAFAFSREDDNSCDGGDSPIVVLKETGETINMVEYLWSPNKEVVGAFDVKE